MSSEMRGMPSLADADEASFVKAGKQVGKDYLRNFVNRTYRNGRRDCEAELMPLPMFLREALIYLISYNSTFLTSLPILRAPPRARVNSAAPVRSEAGFIPHSSTSSHKGRFRGNLSASSTQFDAGKDIK